jgi:hypothetical protein
MVEVVSSGEYRSPTGCVCPLSGSVSCQRHSVRKNAHFHHLCQTRQDYFNMYERCVGPGQEFTNCQEGEVPPVIVVDAPKEPCPACEEAKKAATPYVPPTPSAPSPVQMPSLWQQAKNLTKSVVEHVKTGAAEVTPEEKQARLDICNGCEFFNKENNRCKKCGCMMLVKSAWESASCPIGLWGRGKNVR